MTLSINYDRPSPLLNGLPETIAQYKIGKGTKKKADVEGGSKTGLIIRVRNNLHQIPELESVSMTESWTEIEKIPIAPAKKPAPAKNQKKRKKRQKRAKQLPLAVKSRRKERPSQSSQLKSLRRKLPLSLPQSKSMRKRRGPGSAPMISNSLLSLTQRPLIRGPLSRRSKLISTRLTERSLMLRKPGTTWKLTHTI